MQIGIIVEGDGDVEAVPVLMRRIAAARQVSLGTETVQNLRLPKSRLLRSTELERAVDLLARRIGPEGRILIVLDADDDCPAKLGLELLSRARTSRPDRRIGVALAKREFESWFFGAVESLRGRRGIVHDAVSLESPENVRGAKERLASLMLNGYSPTVDQAALAAGLDLEAARRSPSFDKFRREVESLITT